jgi:aspartyl/asparaginyl beta-hydroxylase (cupin superfamily)
MLNSMFIWIGIVVVTLVICVSLLIFAPRSINFYKPEIYPIIQYLHENNLQCIKDDFSKIKSDKNWMEYPIGVDGTFKIFPLYMFSISKDKNIKSCQSTYNLIQNIPDIKSCAFMNLSANSQINKNKGLKLLCNNSLRCLIVLNAKISSIDNCGIWVNGEQKKMLTNNLIIFDASKEYSIYNKTNLDLEFLLIDVKRPEKIPTGISERIYDNKIQDFIHNLSSN